TAEATAPVGFFWAADICRLWRSPEAVPLAQVRLRPEEREERKETMTLGTATKHDYGEPSYWDRRYRQYQGPFDWYQKYQSLAPLFDLYLRRPHRLLLVGCGNSGPLSLRPHIKMDVRDMDPFQSCSFDAVIDKGTHSMIGTLDSIMITYGDPSYRLRLLRDIELWTISMHVLGKFFNLFLLRFILTWLCPFIL
ncbi:hypothetical protein BHM03_00048601, partial [Ensete ventricosum]